MINHNIVVEYVTVFIMSFIFVYSITPWIIKLAHKINFVDNPNARKIHKKAIPLMGGLSLFLGFIFLVVYDILIATNREFNIRTIGFLLGAFIIVLVGLIDDKRGMHPYPKMLGQFLACSCFIFSNFGTLEYIGLSLFGGINIPVLLLKNDILFSNYLSLPLLYVWMIGLMNATNFLDNMDGMISGISGIMALGFFAFTIVVSPNNISHALWISLMGLLSLSFSGSALGFLRYNFNPAKIFLGDAGSMFIGYFLSTMGILMANFASIQFQSKWFYLLPLILISYAIFDISFVSITRKLDGRYIMQGGKDHTTHRMRNVLKNVKVTALTIYSINVLMVIVTILVSLSGSVPLLLITFFLCIACYFILGRLLYRVPIEVPENQKKKK